MSPKGETNVVVFETKLRMAKQQYVKLLKLPTILRYQEKMHNDGRLDRKCSNEHRQHRRIEEKYSRIYRKIS